MAKIVVSSEARKDLTDIGDYIAYKLRNKTAAKNMLDRIRIVVMSLKQFPESGTPLDLPNLNNVYRYLVCGSYMVFYHLSENMAYVDRILYARRDYLSLLFGDELAAEDSTEINS